MDNSLEMKLVKEFPSFFRDYKGDPRKTCMAWGLCTGNGWFDIIWNFCTAVRNHQKIHPDCKDFYFTQIKEKFGTLQLYTYGECGEIAKLIAQANRESVKTCEECGSKTEVREDMIRGWISVKCQKCWNALGKGEK